MILGYQVVHQPRCHIRKKFFFFFATAQLTLVVAYSIVLVSCYSFFDLTSFSPVRYSFSFIHSFMASFLQRQSMSVHQSVLPLLSGCILAPVVHTHTNPLNHSYNHTFVCVSIYPNALAALKLLCPVYAPSRTHILYS